MSEGDEEMDEYQRATTRALLDLIDKDGGEAWVMYRTNTHFKQGLDAFVIGMIPVFMAGLRQMAVQMEREHYEHPAQMVEVPPEHVKRLRNWDEDKCESCQFCWIASHHANEDCPEFGCNCTGRREL